MPSGKFDNLSRAQTAETTLELLEVVAESHAISQRSLAGRLGIALGLTNAVLKRCIKKGLLKVQHAPARRYAYYLTPKGFAEKTRLTADYLSYSLQFYRQARQEYGDIIAYCETRGWTRIVLVGASELAEIASLSASAARIEIVGILDAGRNDPTFCDIPVFRSLDDIEPSKRPNAVLLADVNDPQSAFESLIKVLPQERVLVPKLMRVMTDRPAKKSGQSEKLDHLS